MTKQKLHNMVHDDTYRRTEVIHRSAYARLYAVLQFE
jgi:hypothetical protein